MNFFIFFLQRIQISKKKCFSVGGGGGEEGETGGGRGRG